MASYENNWALDFCLYCDKQTNTPEPYCSQACRMADLEKPGYSSTTFSDPSKNTKPSESLSRSSTHFKLAPSVNFESYRHRTSSLKPESSPPVSPKTGRDSHSLQHYQTTTRPNLTYRSTYDGHYYSNLSGSSSARLNSSSSRSSLSSNSSTHSNPGLTQSDLTQLQGYANAFDHVRDFKRRITLG